jgi:hypothetical protein
MFDIWCAQVSDEVIIIASQTLTKVHFLVAKPNCNAAYITPKGISQNQIKLSSFLLVDHQWIPCSMQQISNLLFQQYAARKLLGKSKEQKA